MVLVHYTVRPNLHHIHNRKISNSSLRKYPSKNKYIKFLDKIILAIAVIGPALTIPQIFRIFYYQNATGVSIITWSLYVLFDIPWIVYGVIHKEKPIIIAYAFWVLTGLIVVLGILMYG
jgi:uncharacterized protein with PQ loop repeat